MDAGVIVTGITAGLGGIIWLVRLEGRVNAHEAACLERQKRLDERHGEISDRLGKIDDKLDQIVERL